MTSKLNLFLFFFFISILISSCGKNKEIKIIAKNAATGTPYAGLEYRIMSSRTGADGEKYRTEASGTLNENGEAMVNVRQKNRTYSVIVNEPANTCYNKQITQYFDSPYDVNGTFTFEFAECAYLTISINNIDCQNSNDKIVYEIKTNYDQDYSITYEHQKFGCYSNTFIESKVPSGDLIAIWSVTKNNITNNYDSIFNIQPDEHKIFTINY